MKRVLSLVLVLALVLGMVPAGFAADKTAGEQLKELGLISGDANGNLNESKNITRAEMMVVLSQLLGKKAEAEKFSTPTTFTDSKTHWAKNYIAYAEKENWTSGKGNGLFAPNDMVSVQEAAAFMLKALGYTVTDFSKVVTEATEKGIMKGITNTLGNAPRSLVFQAALNTLDTVPKDGKEALGVTLKIAGFKPSTPTTPVTPPVVTPASVKVSSAVALNSKVVEVKLTEAATAVEAKMFTVKDAAGADLVVSAAKLAPYVTTGKTVLVTLEKDTAVGTLYTITSGETKANFGGKAVDAAKPTVSKVEVVAFNEITVTFSEAVELEGAKITLAKKYGDKAALEATTIKYGASSSEFTVMTADQAASTLYGAVIEGVKDLAGNTMTKDEAQTFVGKAKPTAAVTVASAYSYNPEEIIVVLSEKLDTTTAVAANFTVEEAYGAKTKVEVTEARIATTSDVDNAGAVLTAPVAAKSVVLTVPGLKGNTLYKVTAANLKDFVGNAFTTTAASQSATTIGVPKPTTTFGFDSTTAITVKSNTSIEVKFARKVDKALAETVANYTITEAYGAKTALAVTAATLKSTGTTVTLTVGEMKNVLYKVTVANLKDIYGNAQVTGASAETTFVGAEKAAKISAISSITRMTDTTIKVKFNQKVASNATDVSLYTIDNSIGYPEKAVIESTGDEVTLTIPKTKEGVSYKLTVKGLNNTDGVAMDAAGVTANFAGQGIAAGLPVVQAVIAVDKQTVKVFFDRAVTDATIKGVLWATGGSTDNVQNFFQFRQNKTGTTLANAAGTLKAYADTDANVLVITSTVAEWTTGSDFTTYIFDLATAFDAVSVKFDTNVTELQVAANGSAVAQPVIEAVQGVDSKTIRVYFSKPVAGFTTADVTSIVKSSDNSAVAVATVLAVPGTSSKEWLITTTTAMTGVSYKVTFTPDGITDRYATNILVKDDTTPSDNSLIKEFAGNASTVDYITSVYAIMTDNRTIEVYYPEVMKYTAATTPGATEVDRIANYSLKKTDGSTALAGTTPGIKFVSYSSTTNKAVLYLDGNIDSAETIFGLVIDTGMANFNSTKTIAKSSTDNANLVIQVARNTTTTNLGPAIDKVTIAGDRRSIKVDLTEPAGFGTAAGAGLDPDTALAVNELPAKDTATAFTLGTKAHILSALTINTTMVGETAAADLGDADLSSVVLSTDGTQITLNLARAVKAGAAGYVTTKVGTADTAKQLFNYTLTARSQTTNESKVAFAAPSVSTFDYTDPTILARTTVDADKDGFIDGIRVTFSEEINDSTVTFGDFAVVGYTVTGFSTGSVANDNIIVLTLTEKTTPDTAATPNVTYTKGTLKDLGNNFLATTGAVAAVDAAAPVLFYSVIKTAGATAGFGNDANDVLKLVFSEPVNTNFAVATAPTAAELNALFLGGAAGTTANPFAGTNTFTATNLSVGANAVLEITLATGSLTTPILNTHLIGSVATPTANDIEDALNITMAGTQAVAKLRYITLTAGAAGTFTVTNNYGKSLVDADDVAVTNLVQADGTPLAANAPLFNVTKFLVNANAAPTGFTNASDMVTVASATSAAGVGTVTVTVSADADNTITAIAVKVVDADDTDIVSVITSTVASTVITFN